MIRRTDVQPLLSNKSATGSSPAATDSTLVKFNEERDNSGLVLNWAPDGTAVTMCTAEVHQLANAVKALPSTHKHRPAVLLEGVPVASKKGSGCLH